MSRRSTTRPPSAAVLGLTLAGVVAGAGVALAQDRSPAPLSEVRLIAQRAIEVPDGRLISMSPDGQWLAEARPARGYPRGELCVVAVDTLETEACADLSGLGTGIRVEDLRWSPDSRHLAFSENAFQGLRDGDLWLMDAATGALTNLDDDAWDADIPLVSDEVDRTGPVTIPVSPAFSPDGTLVAFSRSVIEVDGSQRNAIAVVPVAGGPVTELVVVDRGQIGVVYYGIHWAPDGQSIYFSFNARSQTDMRNGIWVMRADGRGSPRLVVPRFQETPGPSVVGVSADGRTLLLQDPTALALMMEGGRVPWAIADVATGEVEPLGILHQGADEAAFVAWAGLSPDGRYLLTVHRRVIPDGQVWVRAVGGREEVALVPDGLDPVGPIALNLVPTWATDGSVFLTGAGAYDRGTLLTIEGGLPEG